MKCAQKSNKSLSRQGSVRSPLERVAVLSLFLHRTQDSGVRVNLCHLSHNAAGTACRHPHQYNTIIGVLKCWVLGHPLFFVLYLAYL